MTFTHSARILSIVMTFTAQGCVSASPNPSESELRKAAITVARSNLPEKYKNRPDKCYHYKFHDEKEFIYLDVIPMLLVDSRIGTIYCGQGLTVIVNRITQEYVAVPMR